MNKRSTERGERHENKSFPALIKCFCAFLRELAAAELQTHLRLVTGQTLPITTSATGLRHIFYVGLKPAADTAALASDEGRYLIGPTTIHLYGHDDIRLSACG